MTASTIHPRDRLIFALDVPDATAARHLVEQLGESVTFYKIGLELMAAGGYFELVEWLLKRNKKVFADLKLFDVPATVSRAVSLLANRGITFATVHGNQGIMEAAAAAKGALKILAATVLTSLDRGDLDDPGFKRAVEALAKLDADERRNARIVEDILDDCVNNALKAISSSGVENASA